MNAINILQLLEFDVQAAANGLAMPEETVLTVNVPGLVIAVALNPGAREG